MQYNFVDILSRLKIVCLEKSRDEARKKYRLHKNDYVNNCLGKPLDKLSVRCSNYSVIVECKCSKPVKMYVKFGLLQLLTLPLYLVCRLSLRALKT